MTQKKSTPKKAPKRVERVERSSLKKRARSPSNEQEEESDGRSRKDRTKRTQRVERVERSSLKKRTRSPSDEEEEESDERNKKRREATKIS